VHVIGAPARTRDKIARVAEAGTPSNEWASFLDVSLAFWEELWGAEFLIG